MYRRRRAWVNAVFLLVTLVINGLGAMGLIGGLSQKQISDMYLTLITPSPATFSIWSLIYILLMLLVGSMIFRQNESYYKELVDEISDLYRISCVLNIIWIISFSFLLVELSVLFIFAFAIVLSLICLKLLKINDNKHILAPLTFGIYTGWLFIATVVNIAAALVKIKWTAFNMEPEIMASLTLILALGLVYMVIRRIKNIIFPLPIAWAYFGIYSFLNSQSGFNGQFKTLSLVSLIGIGVLLLISVIQFYKNNYYILDRRID